MIRFPMVFSRGDDLKISTHMKSSYILSVQRHYVIDLNILSRFSQFLGSFVDR